MSPHRRRPIRSWRPATTERAEEWERTKTRHGNSYTYVREFQSFTGFGGGTTLVVTNGVVTERHYKAQNINGGDVTMWSEHGAQVGSHTNEGFPASSSTRSMTSVVRRS